MAEIELDMLKRHKTSRWIDSFAVSLIRSNKYKSKLIKTVKIVAKLTEQIGKSRYEPG